MPSSKISPSENILIDLIHDLRQDLGNIETSVYCLGLQSDGAQTRAYGYLRAIEQQVARAESRLDRTGSAFVHGDMRSDNICLAQDRVIFVDWSDARRGAGFG